MMCSLLQDLFAINAYCGLVNHIGDGLSVELEERFR